jgi:hypothetical protein
MFNNTNKQAKNTATNNAVQAFLDNGGTVTRRKSNVPEVSAPPANYFTSTDAPKAVDKLDSWEVALAKLTTVLDGSIKVVWNDGRVASSVEEMYGL